MRTDDVTQATGEELRFPGGVRLGRGHRELPDRGRRRRGRPRTVDLGHVLAPPRRGARRRHRRRRRRPLPPLPRGRRAAGRPRRHALPLLAGLAAAAARRAGPGQPGRAGLLPAAGRRAARPAASSRGSRSTTGTCRRRWRTPAAGRRATPPSASPTTPALVHDRLGDRVRTWTTLNEPWCSAFLGYAAGDARARAGTEPAAALAAAHHLLLGHGLAVAGACATQDARQRARHHAQPAPGRPGRPTTRPTSTPPAGSTRCPTGSSSTRSSAAAYPDDLRADVRRGHRPRVRPGRRRQIIAAPIDLLGVNYYRRRVVRPGRGRAGPTAGLGRQRATSSRSSRGLPATAMGWEIDPSGLYDVLRRVTATTARHADLRDRERRRLRGRAGADGEVADPRPGRLPGPPLPRRARRPSTTASTCAATSSGRCWTTSSGRSATRKRFGLVYVDYATQRRTPKASARWFAEVTRRNGLLPG